MCGLIYPFPNTVLIDGQPYGIRTDFQCAVKFELTMQDNNLTDEEKSIIALEIFYPVIPENLGEAINMALWFYSCGKLKDDSDNSDSNIEATTKKPPQIYSFEHDWGYLYAAFLAQYNIDLTTVTNLHWWKFRALFDSLEEERHIQKIMGFRAMAIPSDMPKEQKRYYKKMKQLYRLPDGRSLEEKDKDFTANMSAMF